MISEEIFDFKTNINNESHIIIPIDIFDKNTSSGYFLFQYQPKQVTMEHFSDQNLIGAYRVSQRDQSTMSL